MRTMWTGSLSFGLVNIPVKLYNGTQDNRISFDMLHKTDLSPIRYARVCKEDGQEVPYDEIVKGYEVSKGDYIVLDDKDFERANVKATKTIDIISFADIEDVDPIYYEKPYYLEPDKGADKAYAMLREALKKSGKVGITKFVLRNREHLAMVRPSGDMLVLNQMRFADEIKSAGGLKMPKDATVTDKEIDMAIMLIDQLATPFNADDYFDTYQKEIERVIDEKSEGKVPEVHGELPKKKTGEVKDLMSLLKASLQRDLEGGEKPARQPSRAAQAKAANKPAAKKTAAKSSAAKPTTAGKSKAADKKKTTRKKAS